MATIPHSSKILIPIRYAAWLNAEVGSTLHDLITEYLKDLSDLKVTRLPRAFCIDTTTKISQSVDIVHQAATKMEDAMKKQYPPYHRDMGPVWTGTLQVVFAEAEA